MTSVLLWLFGTRFTKGYITKYGEMPRLTWMFRPCPDPELDGHRRQALLILPLVVLGAVVYVAATGPLP